MGQSGTVRLSDLGYAKAKAVLDALVDDVMRFVDYSTSSIQVGSFEEGVIAIVRVVAAW